MIIIWRGWGILALLFALAGIALGGVVTSAVLPDAGQRQWIPLGIGLMLGGAACYWAGLHLNVTRPDAKVREYLQVRERRLWDLVRAGQFQVTPGAPAPAASRRRGIRWAGC